MESMFKRVTVFVLALLTFVMFGVFPFSKASAAVMYSNTMSATMRSQIDSDGNLSTALKVTGYKGITTRIEVELYVEKKVLGLFWSRVNIGGANNTWTDSINSYIYTNTFGYHLTSTGTYRVTVTYTVHGSGGADDVITLTETATY